MIFQEASTALSPVHTVGWQLSLALRAGADTGSTRLRPGPRGLRPKALGLLERVELPDPASVLEAYPHQLSVGMRQRVLIAMALACDPQLIIADEPTTGLDAPVQAQILELFRKLLLDGERSAIFITNDLGVVAEAATDVAILYRGQIVELAPVQALLAAPQHPYTQALLSSLPRLDRSTAERERAGASWAPSRLSVLPPSAAHDLAGPGCRFSPRCPRHLAAPERYPRCRSDRPDLDPPQARHRARCFYPSLSTEEP
jgi:oligopeptide/dipeptide ABC transporter ATP-binding protein